MSGKQLGESFAGQMQVSVFGCARGQSGERTKLEASSSQCNKPRSFCLEMEEEDALQTSGGVS